MASIIDLANPIPIIADGGDAICAPRHTNVSLWAALGGGADGLALHLQMSIDHTIICYHDSEIPLSDNATTRISSLPLSQIQKFNAGASFRSVILDSKNQPKESDEGDYPWEGRSHANHLQLPTLEEVFRYFSRRTTLYLVLPHVIDTILIKKTIDLVHQFGLESRITFIASRDSAPLLKGYAVILRAQLPNLSLVEWVECAINLQVTGILIPVERLMTNQDTLAVPNIVKTALTSNGISLMLCSDRMPYAFTPYYYALATEYRSIIHSILTKAVLPSVQLGLPNGLLFSDNFNGQDINRQLWSAGYSHENEDTRIYQDNGLHIDIKEGQFYSGAGIVSEVPIHGAFDARVAFEVTAPQQGTTFELAAIAVDPGYHNIDNTDSKRKVNLCFDVHGSPPYASAERDEDNGFRFGWNNGYSLTKISESWEASSANMYNKYSPDVGDGSPNNPIGELRLVRNGSIFTSYYRDKHNSGWVCSGSMLVPSLGSDIHLRLAAKHWHKIKDKLPPANKVTFSYLKVYQR